MRDTSRAIAVLAMVAILAMSVAGPSLAAAPTVDTGAGNGSTQSDLTDGDTITYNASTNSTLQANFDSANGSFKILQNNTLLSEYKNDSSPDEISVSVGATNELNLTLTDDETGYDGIVADAGETVELTYRLVNDTDVSDPDTTNVTVNWQNHENKSFERFESGDVDSVAVSTIAGISAFGFGPNVSVGPAQSEVEDVGVNGEDQESVTIHVDDADAVDALDETHSKASDTGISWMGSASFGGQSLPVLAAGEDGPSWLDEDEDAYATINEDGDEVVVHNAGSALGEDTEEATLTVVGAEDLGFTQARSLALEYGASQWQAFNAALSSGFDINGDPSFGES